MSLTGSYLIKVEAKTKFSELENYRLINDIRQKFRKWYGGYTAYDTSGDELDTDRYVDFKGGGRDPRVFSSHRYPLLQTKHVVLLYEMSSRTTPLEPLYSNLIYCSAFGINYIGGRSSIYAYSEKAYQIKGNREKWFPRLQGSRIKSLEHNSTESQNGFNSIELLNQVKMDQARAVFVVAKERLDGCSGQIQSLRKAGFGLTGILMPSNDPNVEKGIQQMKEDGFSRVVKLTKLEDLPLAILRIMTG